MELIKYKQGEVLAHIRHDLRQLPAGKSYGNESVDLSLSYKNTKLIDRGSTAEEVNRYRKSFEKSIFQYNRRGLVKAVELVIQCPDDCPLEQRALFFETVLDWYCDTYLPAGKDCVFLAEIHRDEHKFVETENGTRDISKEHLHIAYPSRKETSGLPVQVMCRCLDEEIRSPGTPCIAAGRVGFQRNSGHRLQEKKWG